MTFSDKSDHCERPELNTSINSTASTITRSGGWLSWLTTRPTPGPWRCWPRSRSPPPTASRLGTACGWGRDGGDDPHICTPQQNKTKSKLVVFLIAICKFLYRNVGEWYGGGVGSGNRGKVDKDGPSPLFAKLRPQLSCISTYAPPPPPPGKVFEVQAPALAGCNKPYC